MPKAQPPPPEAADRRSQSRAHACRAGWALALALMKVAAGPNPAPAPPDLQAQRFAPHDRARATASPWASHGASALPFLVIAAWKRSANQGRSAPIPVLAPHRAAAMVDVPDGSGAKPVLVSVLARVAMARWKPRQALAHPAQTSQQRRPRVSAPTRQSPAPPPAGIGGSSSIRSSSRAFPSDLSRANSPSSAQSCGESAHYGAEAQSCIASRPCRMPPALTTGVAEPS